MGLAKTGCDMLQNGRYKHYKGKLYEVIGIAEHSETGEKQVVYIAQYGECQMYVRSLDDFLGKVKIDGEEIPRFSYVGPE